VAGSIPIFSDGESTGCFSCGAKRRARLDTVGQYGMLTFRGPTQSESFKCAMGCKEHAGHLLLSPRPLSSTQPSPSPFRNSALLIILPCPEKTTCSALMPTVRCQQYVITPFETSPTMKVHYGREVPGQLWRDPAPLTNIRFRIQVPAVLLATLLASCNRTQSPARFHQSFTVTNTDNIQ
jgi:hypothetical protein